MLTVISLGAGVQSSTMALMASSGEITPMPDCAIFADTQAEPKHVYEWLDWLETQLPFPVYTVTAGSLRDAVLEPNRGFMPVPFYVRHADGSKGLMRRQCTREYKIAPIQKKLRELCGLSKGEKHVGDPLVCQWIGISQDEIQRMKFFGAGWGVNRWPLLERGMTRGHCLEWMRDRQYPTPPRSACTFCPLKTNAEFSQMKKEDSESWADAVYVDNSIRDLSRNLDGASVYVHRSLEPLENADILTPEDRGQMTFLDECDGMCGV